MTVKGRDQQGGCGHSRFTGADIALGARRVERLEETRGLVQAVGRRLAEVFPAELLAELGSSEVQLLAPESIEHLQRAIDLAPDVRWRAGVARSLARALGFRDRVTQAIAVLERAEDEVGSKDAELALALANEIVFYGRVDPEGRGLTRDRAPRLAAQFARRSQGAKPCPSYTSDAVDELRCVDLGSLRTLQTHGKP